MDKKHRKMIAPVLITVFVVVYLLVYGVLMMWAVDGNPVAFLLAVPIAALATAMICVLIARIKEIKGGEEDDLGNY